ncbi:MAG: DUF4129 domain-containing protein [Bacillus sp. (in: Bacteria)]|nr:DUF4129 domain-containing protein [Bacillus sp. (in: firmicutes)]MCM1427535.1 DUF4129 domain-containing protein [Eubacterium sp.]
MKQERITELADIFAIQMNHWTLFSIASAIGIMTGKTAPFVALWLLCSLIPIFFFYIRRYTNGFPAMAISHIVCLVLLFNMPVSNQAVKVIMCIYGIGLFINSFYIRLRKEERLDEAFPPPVAIGIIAVSAFVLHYEEYVTWDLYYIALVAVYFIFYYLRYYLQHYLHFMSVNSGSTGYIPRREIFMSGVKLSAVFILIGVGILTLFSDINWLGWIFGQLKNGIIWLREHGLFAWIASLFKKTFDPLVEQTGGAEPGGSGLMPLEPGEPGLFWVVLEKAVFTIVPIVLICLLCFALFRFIMMAKKLFRQKRSFSKEIKEEEARDIREAYELKTEKKKRRDFFTFLSPTERIRHIYKQRIRSKRSILSEKTDAQPLNTYTARECGALLSENRLARIYEKARYSDMPCTREDVKRAAGKSGTAD